MNFSDLMQKILHRYSLYTCLLVMLVLTTSSCATRPPARYYTLDMSHSAQAQPAFNFNVERFRVAQALSRDEIMIKTSPTEVEYYATDQWVANIGELVARKLQIEMGPRHGERPELVIMGTIQAFEQLDTPDGTQVQIEIDIEVRDSISSRYVAPLFQHRYRDVRSAENNNPASAVRALSAGLEEIARAIADDTRHLTVDN